MRRLLLASLLLACETEGPVNANSSEIEGEWVDLGHDVSVRTFVVDKQKCVVVTEDYSDSVALSCNWGVITSSSLLERPDSL